MKSEHRHELKENELSKFIASLPQFYQDNQKMIIYIGVVAILVILSTWFTIFRKRDEKLRAQSLATGEILSVQMEKSRVLQDLAQGQDSSMMLASKSDKLKELSATTENENMSALALIKAAELLRSELHMRPVDPETPVINHQMGQAIGIYENAIETAPDNKLLVAMAKMGMGLCYEEIKDFAQAEKIYTEILSDQAMKSAPAATQAALRLETIADYKTGVKFLPAPPKPEPVIEATPDAALENLSPGGILSELELKPADSNSN